MLKDELNHDLLARYIPRPGRYALLPELTAHHRVALLCRVLYKQDILEEHFLDKALVESVYPQKDFHRMYVGEIERVYMPTV